MKVFFSQQSWKIASNIISVNAYIYKSIYKRREASIIKILTIISFVSRRGEAWLKEDMQDIRAQHRKILPMALAKIFMIRTTNWFCNSQGIQQFFTPSNTTRFATKTRLYL